MGKTINILIYGAGAVGGTLGWRVSQSSRVRVTAVCRTNYNAVRHSGFALQTSHWGIGSYRPHKTIRRHCDTLHQPYDYIILGTKMVSNPEALVKELTSFVSPNTAICSAQNGVGSDPLLASAFPRNPILSIVCFISLSQSVPGRIIQHGSFGGVNPFVMGIHAGGEMAERALKRLVAMDQNFEAIGTTEKIRWEKMIFNAAWNPSCALFGLDSSQMTKCPLAMVLVRALAGEAYKLAKVCGIDLDVGIVERTIGWASNNSQFSLVPSMLQDMRKEKAVEIEGICGVLVKKAAAVGVDIPTTAIVERILTEWNKSLVGVAAEEDKQEATKYFRARTLIMSKFWATIESV